MLRFLQSLYHRHDIRLQEQQLDLLLHEILQELQINNDDCDSQCSCDTSVYSYTSNDDCPIDYDTDNEDSLYELDSDDDEN